MSAPCFAQVDPALLAHVDVPAVVPALPVMVLSLVYHSVVPTVCYQLGCDLSRIRTALLLGSALPCLMFIAWSAVILGSVPYDAAAAASASGATFDPLAVLRASGDSFGSTVRFFSLLAVCTSFVGFYYGPSACKCSPRRSSRLPTGVHLFRGLLLRADRFLRRRPRL